MKGLPVSNPGPSVVSIKHIYCSKDAILSGISIFIYLTIVMVLDRIFGRSSRDENEADEYIDLDSIVEEPKTPASGKIKIRIEKLLEFRDAERIQKFVREGNIVLAETLELKNKDVAELKRSIERIKKTVLAMNGDIVMGPQSVLIICPPNASVSRIKEE
jgi:SepF-like predicted cell division protein (DUF552 family)